MIPFACPHCRTTHLVNDEWSGTTQRCPTCGKESPVALSAVAAESPTPQDVAATGAFDTPAVEPTTDHVATPTDRDEALFDFLAPARDPSELGWLGPYRVLKVLGAGGMGVVFVAEDPALKRKVALKAMLPALAASVSARKRFLREAQTAAAIEHDHIVPIYQVGEDRGVPYLAMQLLKGESLEERLRRGEAMPLADVIRIGRETALGLAAAHGAGLIHRDIKPANLWLEAGGNRVKILDFGLARAVSEDAQVTHAGAAVGTPAYMAPEQATGRDVDGRCDLFALGCVLYRLCTGEAPFRGKDAISTILAAATEQPRPPAKVNPDIPPALSDLVMWLLAKDAANRPESAAQTAALLARIEGGEEIAVRPAQAAGAGVMPSSSTAITPVQQRAGRPRWRMAALVGGLTLVAGVILVLILTGNWPGLNRGDGVHKGADGGVKDTAGKETKDRDGPKEEKKPPRLKDADRYAGPIGDDREVAKWVRTSGVLLLQVRLVGTPNLPVIANDQELPDKPFKVHSIRFDKRPHIAHELNFAAGLTDLTRLHLIQCPIEDDALSDLHDVPKLKELWILDAEITDGGLVHLKKLRSVEMLLLGGNRITSNGLVAFKALPKLSFLSLSGNKGIRDEGLEHLKECLNLSNLELSETGITDRGMEIVGAMQHVTGLLLRDTGLGDKCLIHMHQGLKMLDLSRTQVTDQGFKELGRLSNLGSLKLRETKITGVGLAELRALKMLRDLDLHGAPLTNESLAALKELPSLELLNLSKTPIGDEAIPYLKALTNLLVLSIADTQLSAEGRAELKAALKGKTNVYD